MTAVEFVTHRRDLQSRVRGAVIEPGAPGWDAATQAFNLAFSQEPTLVAVPEDDVDVVASCADVGGASVAGAQPD